MRHLAPVLAALWILSAGAFPAFAADNQAPAPAAEPAASPPPAPAADNQAAAAGPGPSAAPGTRPVYISMDFTDVDLPVLIKFISEQTKKNFIFDERIQGKITIISPRRITVDEAYNVFLSVLQVKGFATVEQGNTIKIVPLREARQESLPTDRDMEGAAGSEFITRLIPLQNLEAPEVVTLLTPLISKDGLLTAFPASNTLILIDSRSNIDRLLKILSDLDHAGAGSVLRIFPLKYASVTEVARTLDTLYQEQAVTPGAAPRPRAGRPGKARGPAPKFIPDVRTNSVIAVAAPEVLADVEDLIRKLDVPSPENTGKINVYYLENANAEEMAKVLATLAEKRATAAPAAPGQPAAAKGVIAAELEGGVRITADAATNSLIIIASVNDFQTLLEVIRKLDIRRRQVFVEALIMEISLDKSRDVGVEFRGAVETSRGDGAVIGGSNFDFKGNVNDLFSALALGNPMTFAGTGIIAGGIGGNVTLPDGTSVPAIAGIIRAAQERNNVNILSSPHLLTLNNKEAEIIVGENVPFITSQSRDTTNLANVINTVERKDVGITLRMTPHIHESDFVNLEIYQESS
ncbi:MAG: type II secretion system secretin GspD, partial [Deltaproteobacteria bacterium]